MLNEIQVMPSGNNCMPPYQPRTEKRNLPIAPAPGKLSLQQTSDLLRARKKMNYKQNTYAGYQSASIIRRNARERNRVKQVNDGFTALRRHLPPDVVAALSSNSSRRGASKKLSKVETLRMVVEYIRYLQQLLDENDDRLDKSENQENNVYYTPSQMEVSQRLDHGYLLDQTPPSSETSSSPAPSFSSEVSSGGVPGYSINPYPIDKYESAPINPMDEELLDVISWWQQK